ncbi:sigma-70 family RNA polymerase sigma factor [Microbacterium sp. MPKO10]|uniref:sigma-70 family RNA polymerase sigma factor n=1 Tax=Microbacterium sp. MPKO10 TaxID=2989818 RepID=UPI002235826F|nr:sigma-70 family RNA polymerase sigma factor [Microbacterium sp. MPKO10]MCW4457687.1 sigma-70 family RNA polymerase sigma factor [Microbacterium sp. MPKO10]
MKQPMFRARASDASDASLLERTRNGDEAAYAELWRRHSAAGMTVARSITSSLDHDDLVQEAFVRVFTAVRRGGGPKGAFRPYLFTTLRNTAAEWGRKRRETSLDTLETFEDPSTSEAATEAALDRGLTATAFRSLPTRWQEVLWYSEVEQMTPAEVGPLLGMKANSVAALAYRAREGLRQAWIQAHINAAAEGSDCRWTLERMGSYTRSALGKRDTVRFDNHLDECAKCTIVLAEAKAVGSRIALVLLPLTIGATGASAYLAWLQSGQTAAVMAMPVGVAAGVGGPTVAGAGAAAGAGSSSAGSGGSAGGAGATSAASGLSTGAIAVGSTVAAGVLAAAVAAAVIFVPSLPIFDNGSQVSPPQAAGQPPSAQQPDDKAEDAAPKDDTPPADDPPAEDPPSDEPPVDDPPADEPPADDPPAEDPPEDEPGADESSPPSKPDKPNHSDGDETIKPDPSPGPVEAPTVNENIDSDENGDPVLRGNAAPGSEINAKAKLADEGDASSVSSSGVSGSTASASAGAATAQAALFSALGASPVATSAAAFFSALSALDSSSATGTTPSTSSSSVPVSTGMASLLSSSGSVASTAPTTSSSALTSPTGSTFSATGPPSPIATALSATGSESSTATASTASGTGSEMSTTASASDDLTFSTEASDNDGSWTLPLTDLPPGSYTVSVTATLNDQTSAPTVINVQAPLDDGDGSDNGDGDEGDDDEDGDGGESSESTISNITLSHSWVSCDDGLLPGCRTVTSLSLDDIPDDTDVVTVTITNCSFTDTATGTVDANGNVTFDDGEVLLAPWLGFQSSTISISTGDSEEWIVEPIKLKEIPGFTWP